MDDENWLVEKSSMDMNLDAKLIFSDGGTTDGSDEFSQETVEIMHFIGNIHRRRGLNLREPQHNISLREQVDIFNLVVALGEKQYIVG